MKHHGILPQLLLLAACTRMPAPESLCPTTIVFSDGMPATRASDPDPDRISDLNLLIFNHGGYLEEKIYLAGRNLPHLDGKPCHRTRLLKGVPYTFLAAANLGYELPIRTLEEARAYRYHMAYPDEFSSGIPMAALAELQAVEEHPLEIPLERLMAKVELSVDRTSLDEDVQMIARQVKVGNCPSSVQLFGTSAAQAFFANGYLKDWSQVTPLNQNGSVAVYLLENIQGERPVPSRSECSYMEIKWEYYSDAYHTRPGEYLVYRFFLQESPGVYTVRRNVHYRISVKVEGSGLGENGWRVDQTSLVQNY